MKRILNLMLLLNVIVSCVMANAVSRAASDTVGNLTPPHYMLRRAICEKSENRIELARALLQNGMNINSCCKVLGDDEALLMTAIREGDVTMCKFLIQQGARIDSQIGCKANIFHYIAFWPWRTQKVAEYLCKICKDTNLINARDERGLTPIMWAQIHGDKDLVRLLKKHGARMTFKERIRCAFTWSFRKAPNSLPLYTPLVA